MISDRNLAQIQEEFDALALKGAKMRNLRRSRVGKTDYMLSIADWWIEEYRRQGNLTPGMQWVHENIESPMLAQRQNYVTPSEFEAIMNSDGYVAEEKLDGVRMLAFYSPEGGFEFFSRNRSVTDYHFARYTDQIQGLRRDQTVGMFKKSFVLDCELISVNPSINGRIVTDTVLNAVTSLLSLNAEESYRAQAEAQYPLRLICFDVLMFDGKPLMDQILQKRLVAREHLVNAIRNKLQAVPGDIRGDWFQIVKSVKVGKRAFYESLVEANCEGIILKNLFSTYQAREARGRSDWLKMKRSVSESRGSDIDAFITGYELGDESKGNAGLVGSLEVSVYLMPSQRMHMIAKVSNIEQTKRIEMTGVGPDGKPCLKPEYLGKVVTIDGQDLSARALRFTHARITLWREDGKLPATCTFEEHLLNDLVL